MSRDRNRKITRQQLEKVAEALELGDLDDIQSIFMYPNAVQVTRFIRGDDGLKVYYDKYQALGFYVDTYEIDIFS